MAAVANLAFQDRSAANVGQTAVAAVLVAFAGATFDIVIDAYRIELLERAPGRRRLGHVRSWLADRLDRWSAARWRWCWRPGELADRLCDHGRDHGADRDRDLARARYAAPAGDEEEQARLNAPGAIEPKWRAIGLTVVGICWAWALWTIGAFMTRMLTETPAPSVERFHPQLRALDHRRDGDRAGAWSRLCSTGGRCAACMSSRRPGRRGAAGRAPPTTAISALILPLAELVRRLGWGVIIVLGADPHLPDHRHRSGAPSPSPSICRSCTIRATRSPSPPRSSAC